MNASTEHYQRDAGLWPVKWLGPNLGEVYFVQFARGIDSRGVVYQLALIHCGPGPQGPGQPTLLGKWGVN